MFTGIVTDLGEILSVDDIPAGKRTRIRTAYDTETFDIGASIACSGVCHTVTAKENSADGNWFEVESAAETLALTNVSSWKAGDRINLERSPERLLDEALTLADRLANGPAVALGYIKQNLEDALAVDHAAAIDREADRLLLARSTADHKEAVRAFAEKRKPEFSGK